MICIGENTRLEIEKQFIALLLNKNELFGTTNILPTYLSDKDNQKIFKYSLDCYKKNGVINPVKILEEHKDFNINLFLKLWNDTMFYKGAWQEQLKVSEESIITAYKEDIIKSINEKLKAKTISYEDFMKQMKKLDTIQITDDTPILNRKEILDNINTDNVSIRLNNFSKLSDTLKMVQGDFVIIGAKTGFGKSGLLLNLMNDLMERYQCIYFNMEMSKSTVYKRMISIQADIPIYDIQSPSNFQAELKQVALENIEKAKVIVEHKANNIKNIKSIVAKMKDKERHTILFIDHLGLTKVDDKKSLYEQMTEVAKELRQLCLDYDCTIIGASQLNRGAYMSEELSISMLKDSGELENSASKVILLYPDKDGNKEDIETIMNLEIAKNRDGITGIIRTNYNKAKQIFTEI